MEIFNPVALFIVAMVTALLGLAQGISALYEIFKKGHTRRVIVLGTIGCLLFALLSGYLAVQQFSSTSSKLTPQPNTPMAASNRQPSSTSPTDTTQPTGVPSPTDTTQPTDTPTPVPTLPPTPGTANGVGTPLPFVMDCQCANDPVQVRVTSVDIQQSLGRMVWNLTLVNVGTERLSPTFRQIALDLDGQLAFAQGGMVDTPVPLAPYGQSGYIAQTTITFTFVPKQETYVLKAIMDLCQGICDSVFYNGQPFTFR